MLNETDGRTGPLIEAQRSPKDTRPLPARFAEVSLEEEPR
jgi:hypothetical protein